jgi:RhoGAP domain
VAFDAVALDRRGAILCEVRDPRLSGAVLLRYLELRSTPLFPEHLLKDLLSVGSMQVFGKYPLHCVLIVRSLLDQLDPAQNRVFHRLFTFLSHVRNFSFPELDRSLSSNSWCGHFGVAVVCVCVCVSVCVCGCVGGCVAVAVVVVCCLLFFFLLCISLLW